MKKIFYNLIMRLELYLPARLFFGLLRLFVNCEHCFDGYFYPMYDHLNDRAIYRCSKCGVEWK